MDTHDICCVIIARNEGKRLKSCFNSLKTAGLDQIVYVDSGSVDDSLSLAKKAGAVVHELSPLKPFTAARARNKGRSIAQNIFPDCTFIQFIDGDCELDRLWLNQAKEFLTRFADYAVVCGRRREKNPHDSIYNRLCDAEWATPIGEAKACGGDAFIRLRAFDVVGGYNDALIAGEEPEMCLRMRRLGWRIMRLDAEMTRHDAAIYHFAQWWKKTRRSGYAYARSMLIYLKGPEKYNQKEVTRIIFWSSLLPLALLLGLTASALFFWLIILYPLQLIRLAAKFGATRLWSWQRAFFLLIGQFGEALGVAECLFLNLLGRKHGLIEYK